MSKNSPTFVCQNCSYVSLKWIGKCPDCLCWNCFEVEGQPKLLSKKGHSDDTSEKPECVLTIAQDNKEKIKTGLTEFDRVFGKGLTVGSLNLIGGEPGVGKSTLITIVVGKISEHYPNKKTLYVSGEESKHQVGLRFKRLGIQRQNILIYHETSWQNIKMQLSEIKPDLLIIDSIQTTSSNELNSSPGTVSQIREVALELMNYSKQKGITSFVVGHVTKEGGIAGPKILEHMVDTVIYFEGDRTDQLRLLRTTKNRFGDTNEVGIFEMSELGLIEVNNPGKYFYSTNLEHSYGRVFTSVVEGSRVMAVEVQALVVENKSGLGKRVTQGVDLNRLSMLIAVVEKYFSISMNFNDIYINVVSGIRLTSRESDLGIIAAILSSMNKQPISSNVVFLGEVGLTGEIRPTHKVDRRLKEFEQMGYQKVVTSELVVEKHSGNFKLDLCGISHARDLLRAFSDT